MVLQYLNKDGYPMSEELKPIFLRKIPKAGSLQRVARYIVCPETGILKWIGHCENCQWFRGHVKYKGVNCSYKNQKENGKRKNKTPKNSGAIN